MRAVIRLIFSADTPAFVVCALCSLLGLLCVPVAVMRVAMMVVVFLFLLLLFVLVLVLLDGCFGDELLEDEVVALLFGRSGGLDITRQSLLSEIGSKENIPERRYHQPRQGLVHALTS